MTFPNGYDQTIEADRVKLRDEQLGILDATSALMGYAAVDGQTKKTLDLFNLGAKNVGGETSGSLDVMGLFKLIDTDELSATQIETDQLRYVQSLLGQPFGEDISGLIASLQKVFAQQAPNTLAGLAAAVRVLARYEVLFGQDTAPISREDWFVARDQP